MSRAHFVVIDPGVKRPELESLNHLIQLSPLPVTYHLPGMFGTSSLEHETGPIAGIIVFGSAISVNQRTEWQKKLEDWLKPKMEDKIPSLGICYGHQMFAHLFGGQVDFLYPDQRMCLGYRKIRLEPNVLWGGKAIEGEACVSHNEAVLQVPKCLEVIGSSKEVKIDAITHRELPIWSFQFHPEATGHFLSSRGHDAKPNQKSHDFGHDLIKAFLHYAKQSR